MIAMMRERVKQLFNAEIQIFLAESPFIAFTFCILDKDYEAKMKYLSGWTFGNYTKAVSRENSKDLFIKKEKRSRYS